MSTEDEVRNASAKFYAALNRMVDGDAAQLADIWSHSESVTTMHPIGGEQVGWADVKESFEQVAGLASEGHVALDGQTIQTGGELAYELGVERGQFKHAGESITIEQRVTNIYRREAEGWKIVHHHTDVSAAMLELVSRLQAQAA
jgi:ketosteroid isomerase-like protein